MRPRHQLPGSGPNRRRNGRHDALIQIRMYSTPVFSGDVLASRPGRQTTPLRKLHRRRQEKKRPKNAGTMLRSYVTGAVITRISTEPRPCKGPSAAVPWLLHRTRRRHEVIKGTRCPARAVKHGAAHHEAGLGECPKRRGARCWQPCRSRGVGSAVLWDVGGLHSCKHISLEGNRVHCCQDWAYRSTCYECFLSHHIGRARNKQRLL